MGLYGTVPPFWDPDIPIEQWFIDQASTPPAVIFFKMLPSQLQNSCLGLITSGLAVPAVPLDLPFIGESSNWESFSPREDWHPRAAASA